MSDLDPISYNATVEFRYEPPYGEPPPGMNEEEFQVNQITELSEKEWNALSRDEQDSVIEKECREWLGDRIELSWALQSNGEESQQRSINLLFISERIMPIQNNYPSVRTLGMSQGSTGQSLQLAGDPRYIAIRLARPLIDRLINEASKNADLIFNGWSVWRLEHLQTIWDILVLATYYPDDNATLEISDKAIQCFKAMVPPDPDGGDRHTPEEIDAWAKVKTKVDFLEK